MKLRHKITAIGASVALALGLGLATATAATAQEERAVASSSAELPPVRVPVTKVKMFNTIIHYALCPYGYWRQQMTIENKSGSAIKVESYRATNSVVTIGYSQSPRYTVSQWYYHPTEYSQGAYYMMSGNGGLYWYYWVTCY